MKLRHWDIVSVLLGLCCLRCSGSHVYPQHGGHSETYRKQDSHGNYAFGYDIKDPLGAKNFRKESGDGWGNKIGSYGIKDIDGRMRIVEYVADKHGFRAKIKTNEPGTSNQDTAGVVYNGPDEHGHSHTHVPSGDPGSHVVHYEPQVHKVEYEPQVHQIHDYGHLGPDYSQQKMDDYGQHKIEDYGQYPQGPHFDLGLDRAYDHAYPHYATMRSPQQYDHYSGPYSPHYYKPHAEPRSSQYFHKSVPYSSHYVSPYEPHHYGGYQQRSYAGSSGHGLPYLG